jgi:pSer/pThr/pTyr-binding forkhead associated (FHA) protein
MPYLKLQLIADGRTLELRDDVVRLGRDPTATIAFSGDEARVVSTHHAEVRHRDGAWRLVDLESRNGTWARRVRGWPSWRSVKRSRQRWWSSPPSRGASRPDPGRPPCARMG